MENIEGVINYFFTSCTSVYNRGGRIAMDSVLVDVRRNVEGIFGTNGTTNIALNISQGVLYDYLAKYRVFGFSDFDVGELIDKSTSEFNNSRQQFS